MGNLSPVDELCRNVALANRILANKGIVDAFGHVSQRSPSREDRFYISRSMAPGLVTPEDILELDFNGDSVIAGAPHSYLERFIHAEIYRARPDVMAVVHNHSPSVLPFSLVRTVPLRAVCHTAGFIGGGASIFEIRDARPDPTDLLIRDAQLGRKLADCLGTDTVVLMRGHGVTVVGSSLKQAVYNAVYTEVNARVQAEALRLGEVTYMSGAEASLATHGIAAVERVWPVWCAEVGAQLNSN